MGSFGFSNYGKSKNDFVCHDKMLVNQNRKYHTNNKLSKKKDQVTKGALSRHSPALDLANIANSNTDFACDGNKF